MSKRRRAELRRLKICKSYRGGHKKSQKAEKNKHLRGTNVKSEKQEKRSMAKRLKKEEIMEVELEDKIKSSKENG